MIPPPDADLVRRFLEQRDEAAFRTLVERHAPAVLRTAHAVTGDRQAAEDATQEAFLGVSRGLRRYDPRRSFRAWVLGIAVKCASKVARGRRRTLRRENEVAMMPPPHSLQPSDEAHRRETLSTLDEVLRELPTDRRAALQLHYGEGLSHTEVAVAMGVAPGTAKSRVGRALSTLREKLSGRGVSLAVADLSLLLREMQPVPGAELIQACASKAAAGPALALTGKAIAAALLVGAGAVATLTHFSGDEAGPRAPRTLVSASEERGPAPVGPDATPTADTTESDSDQGPVETRPVEGSRDDPGQEETAQRKGRTVVINGKTYDLDKLIKSGKARIVRGGGAAAGEAGPGIRIGGGAGSFAPMGKGGSKWAPLPRSRGSSTVSGRVVDEAGVPVIGARILRISDGVDREETKMLSYAHLHVVAKSGKDGAWTAEKQKHGSFWLVVNFQGLMTRPRGMETSHAVRVTVAENNRTDAVLLELPVRLADLVRLRGVVTDEAGEPMRNVQLIVGFTRQRTDARGRFDAGLVLAGPIPIDVRRTGYEALTTTFDAQVGQDNVAQLTLKLTESGSLRLAGQLLDESGLPVPDATLYLGQGNGTVRNIRSDAQGQYLFERLPDRLAELDCTVHVWVKGYFPHFIKVVKVPQEKFDIRIEHSVELEVTVTTTDGQPIRQIAGELQRDLEVDGKIERRMFRSFSRFVENGVLDGMQGPPGKVYLVLEAPGHQKLELELELDLALGKHEITVALLPSGTPDE